MNKHFGNMWKDFWKNPSIKAGEEFEDEVADYFFPDDIYEMLHRTHDVNANAKRFIRSSMWPDFHFEDRKSGIQFWVECKLRQNFSDDSLIPVFNQGQLKRYQSFENCFLMLCTFKNDEQYFFFVPMNDIKWDNLYFSFLRPYELTMEPPVKPGLIKKYLNF